MEQAGREESLRAFLGFHVSSTDLKRDIPIRCERSTRVDTNDASGTLRIQIGDIVRSHAKRVNSLIEQAISIDHAGVREVVGTHKDHHVFDHSGEWCAATAARSALRAAPPRMEQSMSLSLPFPCLSAHVHW